MKLHRLQPRPQEPEHAFPPLSLEPPSLTLVPPAPMLEPPPEVAHVEPDWRGRTARTQYRDSEIYQPLSSLLLGGRKLRLTLLAAILIGCNAVIGWVGWDAWNLAATTADQALVVGLVAGGLLAGWILAVMEHRYRLRRRFTFRV